MDRSLGLYVKSAICSALFRIRGIKSSLVACEGMLPVLYTRGTVQVGKNLVLRGRTIRCEIGASEPNAKLKLGDRVSIGQGGSIVAYSYIEIGDDALIGDFCAVADTNWHSLDPAHPARSAPVIIGDNVWLGRGVLILPGSKIGNHTVVSAGSIVKGDLPPGVLAAGNPAQVVKTLDIPDDWRRNE